MMICSVNFNSMDIKKMDESSTYIDPKGVFGMLSMHVLGSVQ